MSSAISILDRALPPGGPNAVHLARQCNGHGVAGAGCFGRVGAAPADSQGILDRFRSGLRQYGISCSGCSGLGRESSFTGHIRLGGTVSPHLLLGAESIAWTKSEGGATVTAGNVSLAADYYPQPAGGLFLSAGVGFSRVEASGGGSSSGNTGPGF